MKKDISFVLAMFLFGTIAGLLVTLILMAIAVPQFTQYQLTVAEKADWERIASYTDLLTGSSSWIILAAASLALGGILMLLFLRMVNPHITTALKRPRSVAGAKFLVVFIASLVWLYLLINLSGSFYLQSEISKLIQFGVSVVGTAGLWVLAGERGWAGDFSSWRMPRDAKPMRISLLGAVTGAAVFAITYVFDVAMGKYFILVSEVLDGSGETSFLGFKYLALGTSLQISLELLLIAGFASALAPVQRDAAEIRHRLVKPAVALTAIITLLMAAYSYAARKYDLDKSDLASAAGISSKATESRTLLIFNPSRDLPVTLQEWPLQAKGWSLAVGSTVELTKDNLTKIESYLHDHPDGTVHTYAAQNILMNGYYSLWEVQRGQAWQVKAAESQLLPRLLLLGRFAAMRVTPPNLDILESYSDDKKWYHPGRAARSLSIAYQHFGKPAQARAWLRKSQDAGAEITDTKYLDAPAVTQGTIKGKLFLNGKPLADVKVGLLSYQTTGTRIETFTLTDFSLARSLQDAVRTKSDGSFVFTDLGSAKYLIAIMTEKDVIPFDIKPERIKVSNLPGLIQIGPAVNRNIGTIKITTRHQ